VLEQEPAATQDRQQGKPTARDTPAARGQRRPDPFGRYDIIVRKRWIVSVVGGGSGIAGVHHDMTSLWLGFPLVHMHPQFDGKIMA
jgi:hypothetical protein